MSYTGVDIVEVRAWGNLVGALTRSADANIYVFQYAPEWIRSGIELHLFRCRSAALPMCFRIFHRALSRGSRR